MKRLVTTACLVLHVAVASAQPSTIDPTVRPPPPPAPAEPTEKPVTADDVRDAPKPGEEHGRLDPIDSGDSVGRQVVRGFMWIPRIPILLVAQPVRGALYLQDRYYAAEVLGSLFYSDDKKIAVFPTVLFETGFGLNGGIRAQFRDILGEDERLKLRAGYGGRYRAVGAIDLDTGKRIASAVSAGIDARYEARGEERFSGIGNNDLVPASAGPREPVGDPFGVATRYRMSVLRLSPRLRVQLPASVAITGTGALIRKKYNDVDVADISGDDRPIGEIYATDQVPGFMSGTRFLYDEIEVAWDTRRPAHWLEPKGVRGTGGLALVYAARQEDLDEGPDFYRVGVDVQRYLRFGPGPRVLELRATAELVTGDRDRVPFSELPRLGGADVLRGYSTDRFRDKLAAVAQVNYLWMLSRYLAAVGFVDAGRVYSSVSDVTLDDMRVGFGGALEVYSASGMLIRAQLATSIDGGVTGFVSLDPIFESRSRVERY
ncbi:MAG TPA: BamA/TamA family outer membrane protein [Kofleriaceae bacterium]